jgi:hypothetical protein
MASHGKHLIQPHKALVLVYISIIRTCTIELHHTRLHMLEEEEEKKSK